MNRINYRSVTHLVATLWLVLASASCIRDGASDCVTRVTFAYTYNILSADAFGSQVNQVSLYVFGEDGTLVRQMHSDPSADVDTGFSFALLNLPQGRYRFAAWAQSNRLTDAQASFTVPALSVGGSSLSELNYFMPREAGVQHAELNNLLVGVTDLISAGGSSERNVQVNLKKVTEKIRVILFSVPGGSELDVTDFDISIVDNVGNGNINFDYTLLPDEAITYRPYYAANVVPDPSQTVDPGEIDRAAVVEINTSRLVAANAPRLQIKTADGSQQIVDVDLAWLLSLTEMEHHREWSLQEYLDRQDEFSITFFISGMTWSQTTIIINGWVVNNVEIDL